MLTKTTLNVMAAVWLLGRWAFAQDVIVYSPVVSSAVAAPVVVHRPLVESFLPGGVVVQRPVIAAAAPPVVVQCCFPN
jgi:hypothetical protein